MFSGTKKMTTNSANQKIDTLIGPETSIIGNITSNGVVRIDGVYSGDIKSESEVIIGDVGKIIGNIFAGNVSVSGTVEGNIECTGILEILETGRVVGDVTVNKLNISEGAILNGRCEMGAGNVEKSIAPNKEISEQSKEIDVIELLK